MIREAGSPSAQTETTEPGGNPRAATDPEARPVPAYGGPSVASRGGAVGAGKVVNASPDDNPVALAGRIAMRLVLVLALVAACAVAWKRFQGASPLAPAAAGEGVHVLGTVTLAPQRCVHLVSVGGHRLLLGSSPQQVSLLARLDSAPVQEDEKAPVRSSEAPRAALAAAAPARAAVAPATAAPRKRRPAAEPGEERFEDLVAWVRAIDVREDGLNETEPALAEAPAPAASAPPGGRRWLVESARGSRYEVATKSSAPSYEDLVAEAPAERSLFRVLPGADHGDS